MFPPSPETSSEQMRTVSRFSSSAMSVLARRRRRLRCPALRASRALSLTGHTGRPRASCGSESQCSKQFERLLLPADHGPRRPGTWRYQPPPSLPVTHVVLVMSVVMCAVRSAQCAGCRVQGWCRVGERRLPRGPGARGSMHGAEGLGRSRVGPWRCTKLWARSPCAYKDMRRCPVKHFQDLPRVLGLLGLAAQQQNKLHLGTRIPTTLPTAPTVPTAPTAPTAPVTVCKSGAAREPGSPRPGVHPD